MNRLTWKKISATEWRGRLLKNSHITLYAVTQSDDGLWHLSGGPITDHLRGGSTKDLKLAKARCEISLCDFVRHNTLGWGRDLQSPPGSPFDSIIPFHIREVQGAAIKHFEGKVSPMHIDKVVEFALKYISSQNPL